MMWWQSLPERIDPTLFSVGGFSVSWYGVAFLCGAVISLFVLWRGLSRDRALMLSLDTFLDFSLFLLVGAIVGARFGYALFYNPAFFAEHPLSLISPFDARTGAWTGVAGMSAHGGMLGIVFAAFLFSWRYQKPAWKLLDHIAQSLPLAIFFGRIGNFLAGELFGRVTTLPWGMVFPSADDMLLHHPSQLYEAVGEGLILWLVLFLLAKRNRFPGQLLAWALALYGGIRFLLEYFRSPDPQIGFVLYDFTLGQLLSLLVMILSATLLFWIKNRENAILPRAE